MTFLLLLLYLIVFVIALDVLNLIRLSIGSSRCLFNTDVSKIDCCFL